MDLPNHCIYNVSEPFDLSNHCIYKVSDPFDPPKVMLLVSWLLGFGIFSYWLPFISIEISIVFIRGAIRLKGAVGGRLQNSGSKTFCNRPPQKHFVIGPPHYIYILSSRENWIEFFLSFFSYEFILGAVLLLCLWSNRESIFFFGLPPWRKIERILAHKP